jgi:hypothetical protein
MLSAFPTRYIMCSSAFQLWSILMLTSQRVYKLPSQSWRYTWRWLNARWPNMLGSSIRSTSSAAQRIASAVSSVDTIASGWPCVSAACNCDAFTARSMFGSSAVAITRMFAPQPLDMTGAIVHDLWYLRVSLSWLMDDMHDIPGARGGAERRHSMNSFVNVRTSSRGVIPRALIIAHATASVICVSSVNSAGRGRSSRP